MTLNSFRARFSGILEALEEVAEPAQGNTKTGSTSAYAKEPIKKTASGESNFGYGHFTDAFFGPKIIAQTPEGVKRFFFMIPLKMTSSWLEDLGRIASARVIPAI